MCFRSGRVLVREGNMKDFIYVTLTFPQMDHWNHLCLVASPRTPERVPGRQQIIRFIEITSRVKTCQDTRLLVNTFTSPVREDTFSSSLGKKAKVQWDYCKLCRHEGLWMDQLHFLWPLKLKAEENANPQIPPHQPIRGPSLTIRLQRGEITAY